MNRLFTISMVAAGLVAALPAGAAEWPEKPISLVVPLAPGGSTDTTARMLADGLREILGQAVVVENRPGAGGNIGATYVARARPDGYTFLVTTSTLATNVTLYKHMPIDAKTELEPVAQITSIPNVLIVNETFPAKTVEELAEHISKGENAVHYGSAGNGTSQHLSGSLFNSMVNGDMVHIPYTGGAPANTDLLAGQIQVVFSPLVEVLPFIDSGKVRALGVTTKSRSERLPDVPAIGESLPGYEIALWNGVFAPAGTPDDIVVKLNDAVNRALQEPRLQKAFADQGSIPVQRTPEEFQAFFHAEIDKWGELVRLSGSRIE